MNVQARQVVRYAKKHRVTLTRGVYNSGTGEMCAQEVASYMVPGPWSQDRSDILAGIEAGFEGWDKQGHARVSYNRSLFLRYYKVGQNIARMSKPTHYFRDGV